MCCPASISVYIHMHMHTYIHTYEDLIKMNGFELSSEGTEEQLDKEEKTELK